MLILSIGGLLVSHSIVFGLGIVFGMYLLTKANRTKKKSV